MSEVGPRYFDQSVAPDDPLAPGFVRPNLFPPVQAELSTGRLLGDMDPALRLLVLAGFVSTTALSFLGGVYALNRMSPPVGSVNEAGQGEVVGTAPTQQPGNNEVDQVETWSGSSGDGGQGAGVKLYGPDGELKGWGRIVVGRSPKTGSQWLEVGASNDQAGMGDGTGAGSSLRVGVTGSGRPEIHFYAHNRGSIPYVPDFDIGVGK